VYFQKHSQEVLDRGKFSFGFLLHARAIAFSRKILKNPNHIAEERYYAVVSHTNRSVLHGRVVIEETLWL